jgi:hypothetical protein
VSSLPSSPAISVSNSAPTSPSLLSNGLNRLTFELKGINVGLEKLHCDICSQRNSLHHIVEDQITISTQLVRCISIVRRRIRSILPLRDNGIAGLRRVRRVRRVCHVKQDAFRLAQTLNFCGRATKQDGSKR